MPGTVKKKKVTKKKLDPEVQNAINNLGGLPVPAVAAPVAPAVDQNAGDLAQLNGLEGAEDKPHVNRRRYHMPVRTALTLDEVLAEQGNLLQALNEVDKAKADKKEVVAEWNGIIGRAEGKALEIRKALTGGREEVVEVEQVRDYNAGTLTVFRTDTSDIIEGPRPLNDSEKQLDLQAEATPPPAEGEGFELNEWKPQPDDAEGDKRGLPNAPELGD